MFAVVLALSSILPIALAASTPEHWFIFGDSYSTTTFNWHSAQPNSDNPFGNPALPGLTACGKVPNYVYYASVKYNTTTVYTYNFAQGGATINETIVPPSRPVKTVVDQVTTFEASYTGPNPLNRLSWTGNNSLFSVWIGINDVHQSFLRNSMANLSAIHDELIVSYINNLQRLFTLGARNFLILNVPPTDRTPDVLKFGENYRKKYREGVHDFNAKLIGGISAFRLANPAASLWTVDTYFLLTNILNDPQQYGFVDAVSVSNRTEADVAWCNGFHISPGMHNYVAQGIHAGLSAVLIPDGAGRNATTRPAATGTRISRQPLQLSMRGELHLNGGMKGFCNMYFSNENSTF